MKFVTIVLLATLAFSSDSFAADRKDAAVKKNKSVRMRVKPSQKRASGAAKAIAQATSPQSKLGTMGYPIKLPAYPYPTPVPHWNKRVGVVTLGSWLRWGGRLGMAGTVLLAGQSLYSATQEDLSLDDSQKVTDSKEKLFTEGAGAERGSSVAAVKGSGGAH